MAGFDTTFRAAIPGISLTHKMGSLPHEKPPKYVDPNEALEYFWKQFHRKDILKQIWALLEQGCTVWAINRAILFKAAMEGIIQLNLAIVIAPLVGHMIYTLGKAKGIDVKLSPEFRDKTEDLMMNSTLNKKLGRATNHPLPSSALKATLLPKPEDITKSLEDFTGKKDAAGGLLDDMKKEQVNG